MAEPKFGSEPWEWSDDTFKLDIESPLEISRCLWDEMTQSEEDSKSLFSTPMSDTHASDPAYYTVRNQEVSSQIASNESFHGCGSQIKRRRMLFCGPEASCDSQADNELSFTICDHLLGGTPAASHDADASIPAGSYWYRGSDDMCGPLGGDGMEPVSDRWMAKCLQDGESDVSYDEMSDALPMSRVLSGTKSEEICTAEEDVLQGPPTPLPARPSIHGNRASEERTQAISSPPQSYTKFTTPVAYPFTLLKPSSTEGDITLRDINQLILTPPSRQVQHFHYPEESWQASDSGLGLSGKSIVTRTKIHTEGNGTITIMRTRG